MRKLSDDEIPKLDYGDGTLLSLAWQEEGEPTFLVTLRRHEWGTERTIVPAFTWPEVGIELNAKHGFTPFSYEGSEENYYQRLDDGRWRITLDFASKGAIFITCNDVYRGVSEAGSQSP
jgi:hypothetical protein